MYFLVVSILTLTFIVYARLFTKEAPEVVANYEKCVLAMNRKSYLKEFVKNHATSLEAMLKFRLNMARSLASLSICSYILGIGDRHLDNFLVDSRR